MKNILVPTDFSKCANNALTYAFETARRTGAAIHLLHVVYPTEGVDNSIYNTIWLDNYLETRRRSLDRVVRQFSKNKHFAGVEVQTSVEIGYPATTTCDFADQIKADLIMLGTTGATGLKGAFLGSTAGAVISKTKRPVMTIPPKAAYRTSAHLAFATDFRMSLDKNSLAVLEEIANAHHAKLKIVHILDKPGEQPNKDREAALGQKLGGIRHDFHYIHDADVPQAVNDYLEATDANVLVAVAHEHNIWHKMFYESVTKSFAHHTRVPLLVLHDTN